MARQKLYFDDVFADLMLMHMLNHATFKGAEIGECLAAAAKVVEGNPASWRQAWQEQGEQAERAGKEADGRGHEVSARESYLRAVTYYYHACLAISVDNPAYRAGVEHYRSVFQRFAALSRPPIEVIGIPYQGAHLPAYFLRPDDKGEAHPTVIIGDNTSEELYYWVGPPGVQRGYNVLPVDLPGMGLNEELRRQAAAAVEAAPNPARRQHVFTLEDSTAIYREIDNFSLKHRVMFDWLDEVLGQRDHHVTRTSREERRAQWQPGKQQ